jgi:hypothetical protein
MRDSDGQALNRRDLFAPYEVFRELGARRPPVFVAQHKDAQGKPFLVVVECFEGAAREDPSQGHSFLHDARRIASLTHPNVALVHEVLLRDEDVVVVSGFVDGERLARPWISDQPGMPLEIALRVLVDVLAGVAALHGVRDAKLRPMQLVHGEIAPATIVVGLDGMARVLHAVARRAPGAAPDDASIPYLAPEVRAHEPYDERADVFSVGVLLWEALSERALPDDARSSGHISRATVPQKAPWAKGLVEIAAKAVASSPQDRWPTASAMAAEIRRVAGFRLASVSAAAVWAERAIGERVRARRERLEATAVPPASTGAIQEDSSLCVASTPVPPPSPTIAQAPSDLEISLQAIAVEPMHPADPAPERTITVGLESDTDVVLLTIPPYATASPFDPNPSPATTPTSPASPQRSKRRRSIALAGLSGLGIVILAFVGRSLSHRPPATVVAGASVTASGVGVAVPPEPSAPPDGPPGDPAQSVQPAPVSSAKVQPASTAPSVKRATPRARPKRPSPVAPRATH